METPAWKFYETKQKAEGMNCRVSLVSDCIWIKTIVSHRRFCLVQWPRMKLSLEEHVHLETASQMYHGFRNDHFYLLLQGVIPTWLFANCHPSSPCVPHAWTFQQMEVSQNGGSPKSFQTRPLCYWTPGCLGSPIRRIPPKAALSIAMFHCHCNQSLIAAKPSAHPTENISADMWLMWHGIFHAVSGVLIRNPWDPDHGLLQEQPRLEGQK